jgi:hypothetical protein
VDNNQSSNPRQRYLKRHTALKTERASWDSHWRELSDVVQPRRSRFFTTERNRGTKKHQQIINGTPTIAARTLAAGMMAGMTSEARAWFRLTTADPELSEVGNVRSWLHVVEERTRHALSRSNLYKCLPLVYLDIGTPGTAAMLMEEDVKDFFRFYVFPIGSYCLSNSEKLEVDTLYRDVSMTVVQLVEKFGRDNCSSMVRNAYDRGSYDDWIPVVHVIEPNKDYKAGMVGHQGKPWKSCWLEAGSSDGLGAPAQDITSGFLRESGYEEFPVLAPRWSVTGEDVYGSSPGMEALGDCRALQLLEKRKAQVLDKIANPPMRGPTALRNQRISLLPGETTYVDSLSPSQAFAPVYQLESSALVATEGSAREHEQRINRLYFVDVMLMLANSTDSQKTAREVAELHEEKMLQLGPVFGQLKSELLKPLIERAVASLLRAGDLPPPPKELQGQDLNIEYQGMVEAAQKLLATSGIERLTAFVGGMVGVKPEVLDKLNTDQVVDEYASALGVKPELIRSDEEVADIRAARAQQQQAQEQQMQAAQAVQGAKTLSETDTGGDNALTRMLSNTPGVAGSGGVPR